MLFCQREAAETAIFLAEVAVLFPGEPDNYYTLRDLIPPDLDGALHQAQIIITNYHAFLLRDATPTTACPRTPRPVLRDSRLWGHPGPACTSRPALGGRRGH